MQHHPAFFYFFIFPVRLTFPILYKITGKFEGAFHHASFNGLIDVLSSHFFGLPNEIGGVGPWVKKIDSEELSRIVINFSTKMKIEKHLELEDSWAAYDDYITKLCLNIPPRGC